MFVLSQKRKGHPAVAFFFAQKKVGVPADLDLVSTIKEMRGLEKPPPSD